ncbi:MAG TPA: HAD family hydrolase [Friedmanniella sp.]
MILLDGRVESGSTSEELGVAKPAPSSYLQTCERLRADPATTLHVGDRYDVDVAGARSAGLQALHLDRSHKHKETAEHRITSLEELPGRLRRRA